MAPWSNIACPRASVGFVKLSLPCESKALIRTQAKLKCLFDQECHLLLTSAKHSRPPRCRGRRALLLSLGDCLAKAEIRPCLHQLLETLRAEAGLEPCTRIHDVFTVGPPDRRVRLLHEA